MTPCRTQANTISSFHIILSVNAVVVFLACNSESDKLNAQLRPVFDYFLILSSLLVFCIRVTRGLSIENIQLMLRFGCGNLSIELPSLGGLTVDDVVFTNYLVIEWSSKFGGII